MTTKPAKPVKKAEAKPKKAAAPAKATAKATKAPAKAGKSPPKTKKAEPTEAVIAVVATSVDSGQIAALEQALAEAERARAEAVATLAEMARAQSDLAAALDQALADGDAARDASAAAIEAAEREAKHARAAADEARTALQQAHSEHSGHRGAADQARAALDHAHTDAQRARGAAEQARAALDQAHADAQRARAAADQARADLADARAELAAARVEMASANHRADALEARLPPQLSVAAPAAAGTLICPRCGGKMDEINHLGVTLDRCTDCDGLYFDAGELEEVIRQEYPEPEVHVREVVVAPIETHAAGDVTTDEPVAQSEADAEAVPQPVAEEITAKGYKAEGRTAVADAGPPEPVPAKRGFFKSLFSRKPKAPDDNAA